MKKLILLAAAAATVFIPGCMKTNGNGAPEGVAQIVVKIVGLSSPETRAVDAPGQQGKISLPTDGMIFVIDLDRVIYSEALEVPTAGDEGQILNDGGLFPETSEIYVLANIPTDVRLPSNGQAWMPETLISSLATYNKDYTNPTMGNYDPVNNGPGTAKPINAPNAENVSTVSVPISPLFSRLELAGLKGGAHISSFKVAAVYANNYYPSFTMTGVGAGTLYVETPATNFSGFGDTGEWTSSVAIDDESTITTPATVNALDPAAVTDDDKAKTAWVYHVGSGSAATFIVRLDEIQVYEDVSADPGSAIDYSATVPFVNADEGPLNGTSSAYLLVTGYKNVSAFQRGKIYSVGTLEFDLPQLQADITIEDGVSIEATVTIHDWETEGLDYNLQQ